MSSSPVSRDPQYYLTDGNAILQIETTLFKVHKSVLVKDCSVFANLFSLPVDSKLALDVYDGPEDGVGWKAGEGESDENPIRMQGDTVDELRALLWALYALPAEIAAAMISPDVSQFVNLGRMAHKYHFHSTEAWALQTITSYVLLHGAQLPTVYLTDVTELAVLTHDADLLDITLKQWKRLIGEGKEIARAILTAEELNLRDILGLAYHEMVQQGRTVWDADPLLTRKHRIHLLSGHYTLLNLCQTLPNTPPNFIPDPSCPHGSSCKGSWNSLWMMIHRDSRGDTGMIRQITTIALQQADLVGRYMLAESILKALVEHKIPSGVSLFSMNQLCLEAAFQATKDKVKGMRSELADYFVDVE